jgi:hypothetical protein
MRKFTSILKVLTFINLEIFLLCGLLIISIIYGNKYLKNSTKSVNSITLEISKNELEKDLSLSKIDRFNELDNLILDKSLKNLDLSESLDQMMMYKDSFQLENSDSLIFDSLLIEKSIMFRVIKTYKKSTKIDVNRDDFIKSKKLTKYVPKKTITYKKNFLGKTKVDTIVTYDTITTEENYFDSEEFQKNKSLSERVDYNSFQNYIFRNNDISIKIRSILSKEISNKNKELSVVQSNLIEKLNKNLSEYFKVITIITTIFFITLLLLIRDLRKKSKKEFRDKYLISLILNKKE